MRLNEMSKTFWTDTRREALERQRITPLVAEFERTYDSTGGKHQFYALTVTARESYKDMGIWFDDDARERLISELYHQLEHRLSSCLRRNTAALFIRTNECSRLDSLNTHHE